VSVGEWVIGLPAEWTRPPLSLNYRFTKPQESRIIGEVRRTAELLARQAGVPRCDRIRFELHWRPGMRVSTVDSENPVPTLKACCDGLVDAGVVPDDDRWRMDKRMPVIHDPTPEPGMWMVITALPPIPGAPPVRAQPAPAAGPRRARAPRASSPPAGRRAVPVADLADLPEPTTAWGRRVAAKRKGAR
jgi:crossover junction endodeoxyribonuclease RusA